MAKERNLKLNLLTDTTKFNAGMKSAQANVGGLDKSVQKATKAAAAAFAALAVSAGYAAVKIGKDSVNAAIKDQASQAKLAKALENTTKANDEQIKSVEDWITKQQLALGISDNELRPAFANLARATEDLEKSQSLTNLAMDISAATGRDLETVSLGLAKAYNGNFGALTKLGIPLDENIKKTKDFDALTQQLTTTFAGSADAAADTYEGKLRRMSEASGELQESIGELLLPAVSTFIDYMNMKAIPALTQVRDGFNGVKTSTNGLGFALGEEFRSLSDNVSQLFKNLSFEGGGIVGLLIADVTVKVKRISDIFEAVNTVINKFKKIFGVALPGATSSNASVQSRDAARSAGRNSRNTTALSGLGDYLGGLDSGGGSSSSSKQTKKQKAAAAAQKAAAEAAAKAAKEAEEAQRLLNEALEEAARVAEEAQRAFDDYADSVSNAVSSNLSFEQAFQNRGEGSFLSALRNQANRLREFGGRIAKLIQLGLSRGALSQILAAGPIVGSQIADELIQGGDSAIGETNAIVGSIADFSNQLGQSAATGLGGSNVNGGVNITINGAIDPEGVRRSLELLFQQSGARIGDVNFAGANL